MKYDEYFESGPTHALREATKENTKCGDILTYVGERKVTVVAVPIRSKETYVLRTEENDYILSTIYGRYHTPLTWFKGRPLYKGDMLYSSITCQYFKVARYSCLGGTHFFESNSGQYFSYMDKIHWEKPKKKVIKEGWTVIPTKFGLLTEEEAGGIVDRGGRDGGFVVAKITYEVEEK